MEKQREAVMFFAAVLNGPSVDELSEVERHSRAEELREMLRSTVPHRQLLPATAKQWVYLLQQSRSLAQQTVLRLLGGQKAIINREHQPRLVFRLQARRVEERTDSPSLEDGLYTTLLSLLRHDPFPFGQCPVCRTVFVQMGKGKPRRYCSESCRAKGVPSAGKKTEYMRRYRQGIHEREQATVRRVLREAHIEPDRLALLGKTFQGRKSRRQLLSLLKKAERVEQEVSHEHIPEKRKLVDRLL